jgi:aspartate/tyrosine/aromatic aminotransferase
MRLLHEMMEWNLAAKLSMEQQSKEFPALKGEKEEWQAKMDAALLSSQVPISGQRDTATMQGAGGGGASGSGVGSL